jgi:nucleoid-associated protein EbfC
MSMFDTFKMMAKLGEAKTKINEMKDRLPFIEITEESPEGLIRVTVSADKVIRQLEINENMLLPAAKSDIESRLKETINAAIVKAELLYKEEMKKSLEGVIPDIPGFDMGSLMSKL